MAKLQPVKGTRDLFGEEGRTQHHVMNAAARVSRSYGFDRIDTPMFEQVEVFNRPLGETSDVVTKEMFDFQTKGGDHVVLRPENTAGVVRAIISNGLTHDLPGRYFYAGPQFRYERPQAGRYRQFTQIGVELVGPEQPIADVDVIACGWQILAELELTQHITVHLNTLGDTDSRNAYRSELVAYFHDHRDRLSEDSRTRLEKNPLRILDSKDEGDRALLPDAPKFVDHLNAVSQDHYATVKAGLDNLGLPYQHDDTLVRGFDYYCHTAFEFITTQLGAQGTVLGGGRYDGLAKLLGGPDMPGVGWAAGVDRLAMLLSSAPQEPAPIAVVPLGTQAETLAQRLVFEMRAAGLMIDMNYSGNMKKRLTRANKVRAAITVIIGEDEIAAGIALVRNMEDGTQREVALDALVAELSA
ncbi:MAG: histidine--tRNA ligase [Rhodospirillaceae bacterium]|nr:MAG: histidine--tRNA ligase [Rhodospirillaceae bacterium]